MTRISRSHPRYESLRTRARLAAEARRGLVAPEGLIAHGRGETFDYLLGERTIPSARRAERAAARWLWAAQRPVLSVNGNVAALAAPEVASLARARPGLSVEVNLFHRTPARALRVARVLRAAGVRPILGVHPTVRIPGLPSDRALVDRRGIFVADLCVVPLEDGDRTTALRARGQRVISIDLNPLSRTSRTADLPIVDELTRALRNLRRDLRALPRRTLGSGRFAPFDSEGTLRDAVARIRGGVARAGPRARAPPTPATVGRGGSQPPRERSDRSRRTR